MEILLVLDDELLEELKTKTGISDPLALTTDAMTMLNWAVNEVSAGRIVISTDVTGGDVKVLRLQAFQNISHHAIRNKLPSHLTKGKNNVFD